MEKKGLLMNEWRRYYLVIFESLVSNGLLAKNIILKITYKFIKLLYSNILHFIMIAVFPLQSMTVFQRHFGTQLQCRPLISIVIINLKCETKIYLCFKNLFLYNRCFDSHLIQQQVSVIKKSSPLHKLIECRIKDEIIKMRYKSSILFITIFLIFILYSSFDNNFTAPLFFDFQYFNTV